MNHKESSYEDPPKFTGRVDAKVQNRARGQLYLRLLKFPKALMGILPSMISGTAPIMNNFMSGKVINYLTTYSSMHVDTLDDIRTISLYTVIVAVIIGIARFFDSFFWIRVGAEFAKDLKSQCFRSMMKSEISYFDQKPIGEMLTLLGEEAQTVQDNFGIMKGQQFQSVGQYLVSMILCFCYSWKLALISMCTIPFAIVVIFFFSKGIDRHINLKFFHVAKSMTIAEESLSAIRAVRGANREDEEFSRFMTETNESAKQERIFNLFASSMFSVVSLGVWAIVIGNLYLGSKMVRDGKLKVGELSSLYGFMMFGSMSLIQLQTSMQGEHRAINAGERLLRMINHESSIPFDGGKKIKNFKGHIKFDNVSFKYPTRDVFVLKNVTFEVKPGQMGALVGHSGSGKSTCVQLLERYYDVTEGQILLDGHDIRTLDPHWLHQRIGLVSQEPTLFQLSIKDNIKYGCRDATDKMVERAAKEANSINFIKKLQGQFDYYVGEKGNSVSGGQRQRIAIARALIKNPTILITDEATSALDAESEKKVQIALEKVMQGRTSVVVAHRLSTIKNANVIYVFDAGKIVEYGNHKSLIKKKGHYYELVKRQLFDDEKERFEKGLLGKYVPKNDLISEESSIETHQESTSSKSSSIEEEEETTESNEKEEETTESNEKDEETTESNEKEEESSSEKTSTEYFEIPSSESNDENI